jgi:hypothetical protein
LVQSKAQRSGAENALFGAMLKPNICQDRLGTSIVKVEGEGRFLQQDAAALVTTARLYDRRRDCLLPADVHGLLAVIYQLVGNWYCCMAFISLLLSLLVWLPFGDLSHDDAADTPGELGSKGCGN